MGQDYTATPQVSPPRASAGNTARFGDSNPAKSASALAPALAGRGRLSAIMPTLSRRSRGHGAVLAWAWEADDPDPPLPDRRPPSQQPDPRTSYTNDRPDGPAGPGGGSGSLGPAPEAATAPLDRVRRAASAMPPAAARRPPRHRPPLSGIPQGRRAGGGPVPDSAAPGGDPPQDPRTARPDRRSPLVGPGPEPPRAAQNMAREHLR